MSGSSAVSVALVVAAGYKLNISVSNKTSMCKAVLVGMVQVVQQYTESKVTPWSSNWTGLWLDAALFMNLN